MFQSTICRMTVLSLVLTNPVFSQNINLVGTVEKSMPLTHNNSSSKVHSNSVITDNKIKTITLPEFELSKKTQLAISRQLQKSLANNENSPEQPALFAKAEKKQVQLGMNHVPVLDQGPHGTCVTFAVTAAIDAALQKGDYISQLCFLQLGTYLYDSTHELSGWDGSWGDLVLARIGEYGVVNKEKQNKYGCGGAYSYPYYSYPPQNGMSTDEYAQRSEKLTDKITWSKLFAADHIDTSDDPENLVHAVKHSLNSGNRVTFGVLLPRTDLGTAGAVGWHNYFSDTWVVTDDIAEDLKHLDRLPGHEMIITGYDDDAVAMDSYGHRHHGLFTLRNSWGSWVADWGDFYMSYDYFKALAIDAHSIKQLHS